MSTQNLVHQGTGSPLRNGGVQLLLWAAERVKVFFRKRNHYNLRSLERFVQHSLAHIVLGDGHQHHPTVQKMSPALWWGSKQERRTHLDGLTRTSSLGPPAWIWQKREQEINRRRQTKQRSTVLGAGGPWNCEIMPVHEVECWRNWHLKLNEFTRSQGRRKRRNR